MAFCKSCGRALEKGKKYCSACGAATSAKGATSASGTEADLSIIGCASGGELSLEIPGTEIGSISSVGDDLLNYSFGLESVCSEHGTALRIQPAETAIGRVQDASKSKLSLEITSTLDFADFDKTLQASVLDFGTSEALQLSSIVETNEIPALEKAQRIVQVAGVDIADVVGGTQTAVGGLNEASSGRHNVAVGGLNEVSSGGRNAAVGVKPTRKGVKRATGRASSLENKGEADPVLYLQRLGKSIAKADREILAKALTGLPGCNGDDLQTIIEIGSHEIGKRFKVLKEYEAILDNLVAFGEKHMPWQLYDEVNERQQEAFLINTDFSTLTQELRSCSQRVNVAFARKNEVKLDSAGVISLQQEVSKNIRKLAYVLEYAHQVQKWWDRNREALQEAALNTLRSEPTNLPALDMPALAAIAKKDSLHLLSLVDLGGATPLLPKNILELDPSEIKTYLVFSVINTMVCCPVCGLVALLYSVFSRNAMRVGDYELAQQHSTKALAWNIAGVIISLILWFMFLISDS